MPWVKIDDHFDEHPKLAAVGPIGIALWVSALAYCNRNLTDGFVPMSVAQRLIDGRGIVLDGHPKWDGNGESDPFLVSILTIEELVGVGLFEEVSGGYRIHDYADYQPTKVEILADRAQKVAAGQAGGIAAAKARAKAAAVAHSKPVPVPDPVPPSPSIEGSGDARAIGKAIEEEKPWVTLTPEERAEHDRAEKDETIRRAMLQVGLKPELVK